MLFRSGKRPALDQGSVVGLVLIAVACVAGLVALGIRRGAPAWPPAHAPWLGVFPILAIAAFVWLLRGAITAPKAPESSLLLQRAVVATPPASAAAWALSLEHPVAAAAFTGTAIACWTLAYLAREVHAMLAAPPAWRG